MKYLLVFCMLFFPLLSWCSDYPDDLKDKSVRIFKKIQELDTASFRKEFYSVDFFDYYENLNEAIWGISENIANYQTKKEEIKFTESFERIDNPNYPESIANVVSAILPLYDGEQLVNMRLYLNYVEVGVEDFKLVGFILRRDMTILDMSLDVFKFIQEENIDTLRNLYYPQARLSIMENFGEVLKYIHGVVDTLEVTSLDSIEYFDGAQNVEREFFGADTVSAIIARLPLGNGLPDYHLDIYHTKKPDGAYGYFGIELIEFGLAKAIASEMVTALMTSNLEYVKNVFYSEEGYSSIPNKEQLFGFYKNVFRDLNAGTTAQYGIEKFRSPFSGAGYDNEILNITAVYVPIGTNPAYPEYYLSIYLSEINGEYKLMSFSFDAFSVADENNPLSALDAVTIDYSSVEFATSFYQSGYKEQGEQEITVDKTQLNRNHDLKALVAQLNKSKVVKSEKQGERHIFKGNLEYHLVIFELEDGASWTLIEILSEEPGIAEEYFGDVGLRYSIYPNVAVMYWLSLEDAAEFQRIMKSFRK